MGGFASKNLEAGMKEWERRELSNGNDIENSAGHWNNKHAVKTQPKDSTLQRITVSLSVTWRKKDKSSLTTACQCLRLVQHPA